METDTQSQVTAAPVGTNHQRGASVDGSSEHVPMKGVGCNDWLGVWCVGVPDVKIGGQERFWCAYRGHNGKLYHKLLTYCNAHVMPLSDQCYGPPAGAKPVGDDGDYEWTGWHHESCEQCDTQWTFDKEVIAWMRLPRYSPNGEMSHGSAANTKQT